MMSAAQAIEYCAWQYRHISEKHATFSEAMFADCKSNWRQREIYN
jgi:hypothetical protein